MERKNCTGFISAHCIAELYSVLSRYHHDPILSPKLCMRIIHESVLSRFKPIDLSIKDYRLAMNRVAIRELRGGILYDSLHLQAAVKKSIGALVTLNVKDYTRLIEPDELEIVNPLTKGP